MTLEILLASKPSDELQVRDDALISEILYSFDQLNWKSEVEIANQVQSHSPTLGVIREKGKEFMWISAIGDKGNIEFIFECHFPGTVKKFFGLSKKPGIVHVSKQGIGKEKARELLKVYLDKNYEIIN